ncbi:MAG TPA: IS66 family transposase [Gemmataceae bacterium]|nr:IS66 family transposase [Gemmataceae bacterium]
MPPEITIPNELSACQALIVEMARIIKEQKEQLVEQQLEINELMQRAFRRRSERYLANPEQMLLDFGETPEAGNAAEGLADAKEELIDVPAHTRRRRAQRPVRNEQLPAHLPRREVSVPVPDDVRTCPTHGERKLIGHDITETLKFERPKLWVEVRKYPKYACAGAPACGVQEPARPASLVEGNRYDSSVAAEIITAKWGYHLPIYRQQDLFAGSGWTPRRGTLLNIAAAAGDLLPPLIAYLRDQVLSSGYIGTDDTAVTLLLPETLPTVRAGDAKSQRLHEVFAQARAEGKKSVTGRMWAYRSLTVPLNVFDFTVSHHRDGPDEFLVASQFQGKLVADCYTGYQGITLRSAARIERAACNAHARRKVFEARDNHPLLAGQVLALYRELYDIEDRGRALPLDERLALRQSEARGVWNRLQTVIDGPAAVSLLPKEKMSEALNYLRNHGEALRLYLSDPQLPIDNNDVEQLMKQVAVGRKNWLFLGSVPAGERAANFFTLVSSALRSDLDIYAYIKSVLDTLLGGSTDYAALRPDVWAQAHPEAIRNYRKEERRDRVNAKTIRRERRRRPQP